MESVGEVEVKMDGTLGAITRDTGINNKADPTNPPVMSPVTSAVAPPHQRQGWVLHGRRGWLDHGARSQLDLHDPSKESESEAQPDLCPVCPNTVDQPAPKLGQIWWGLAVRSVSLHLRYHRSQHNLPSSWRGVFMPSWRCRLQRFQKPWGDGRGQGQEGPAINLCCHQVDRKELRKKPGCICLKQI